MLDQIGNDDLMFNNDKIISSIQIESSLDNPIKKTSSVSVEEDNDKIYLHKKGGKKNST